MPSGVRPQRSVVGEALPGLLLAAGCALAARMARSNLEALAEVRPHPWLDLAYVDVVVPARNEATRIAACVAALRAQGDRVNVTIVDDASTDDTGARAADAGARVIRVDGPPPGWLGKPAACAAGAAEGTAPWLAFVDADVVLVAGALTALVDHAQRHELVAVSPLLRLRCSGVADSLLVPFAFWQYAVGLPGASQRPGHAILNGQCLVIARRAYTDCGGHAHRDVRGSVVDDSSLARVLVAAGGDVALVRGEQLGEVSMYRGFPEIRAGFGKNIAHFVAADPLRGAAVALSGVAMSAWTPVTLRALRRGSAGGLIGAVAAWLASYGALRAHYRAARVDEAYAALHPIAAQLMQGIAIESLLRAAVGRPHAWKDRPARSVATGPVA